MRHLALLLAACASAAPGATWRPFADDTIGNRYWVDEDSLDRAGELVTFWERLDLANSSKAKVHQVVSHVQVDCAGKRFKMLETIAYSPKGTMVQHDRAEPLDDGWTSAVPDSVSETFVKGACSPTTPKAP